MIRLTAVWVFEPFCSYRDPMMDMYQEPKYIYAGRLFFVRRPTPHLIGVL